MSHLYYIHDPMCSWCWGFRPTLDDLLNQIPEQVSTSRLLGGLAPDSVDPMPEEMRIKLQTTWRHIQKKIPGTRFNFDFWTNNTPRRSTYPACRAVIAARALDGSTEDAMILAIQQAYYLQARNPSDNKILIKLAEEIGLDKDRFREKIGHKSTQLLLESEIEQSIRMGARSFPSLIFQKDGGYWPVAVDYHSADSMLEIIDRLCST
ncbi:MAG: DsbA family protein [Candidatus Thiodiazotropha sp. (ex Lucinoma borealis)]|nr:DsbA family protein [Candidatus Thiodiazotropha sp. (ex Lucinoma borealis)]